jgi:pyridoxine kinase
MGAEFDGIYTGFVASEQQIENIFDFLDTFHKKKTFLLVDPVLGDDGKVFDMFSENICGLMKELAARADIITPNLTELCLLTDTNYRMIQEITDEKHLLKIIEQLARNLVKRGLKTVVVTGVHFLDSDDGILKMGNLAVTEKQSSISAFPYVGGSYSGTGDLFASVLAGGMARGDKVSESIELAGRFIEKAIVDSVEEDVPRNDGVNYEKYLGILM